jgi:dolichol-phosphate mannosyltransferase
MPEVSIVIPTYRERDNLSRLLPLLFQVLNRSAIAAEVIVVDDDSRDGTRRVCRRLAETNPVRLISRYGERGLATAVLRGLYDARGEICVVMDADFSHPPQSVPALVNAVKSSTCDLAIGSRYAQGGVVDANWSWFRRLNSRVASLLARGLTHISDPMSGFFAIKREMLSRAKELRPLGYKIALELIVRCNCWHIIEVPIVFRNRTAGKSKLSITQQFLYLRHLGRLYSTRFTYWKLMYRPIDAGRAPPARRRAA